MTRMALLDLPEGGVSQGAVEPKTKPANINGRNNSHGATTVRHQTGAVELERQI